MYPDSVGTGCCVQQEGFCLPTQTISWDAIDPQLNSLDNRPSVAHSSEFNQQGPEKGSA